MKSIDAIRIAQGEIGVTEYPRNSNKVKYNTWFYGYEVYDGYKGKKYPWCVTFVEWVLRDTKLLMKTASASALGKWFKDNGQWTTTPQKGDMIFFNFHTPGKLADHIGIVESVNNDGSIVTIEGNTSTKSNDNGGAVMRRVRRTNIVGYGRPKYDDADTPKPTTNKRATLSEKANSRGEDVVYLKKRLTSMGFGNLDLNTDIYNKGCGDAVQYLQVINNLKPDRICGEKTWAIIESKK